jgi:GT2 family glycosyltransferase
MGIERARYEYVAFLDDDATAVAGWLAAFDAAIRKHGVLAGGGRVEPVLEPGTEMPTWWCDRNIRSIFGLDHSTLCSHDRVIAIRWPFWLGGGNSVYAKRLLQQHGGFRTDFGPIGPRYRVAEDVDLNARLERAGIPVYYVHDALIEHRVTANRLAPQYIWRRAYWAGRTDAAVRRLLGSSNPRGLPLFAGATLRFLLSRKHARAAAGCRLAYESGYQLQSKLSALRCGWAHFERP